MITVAAKRFKEKNGLLLTEFKNLSDRVKKRLTFALEKGKQLTYKYVSKIYFSESEKEIVGKIDKNIDTSGGVLDFFTKKQYDVALGVIRKAFIDNITTSMLRWFAHSAVQTVFKNRSQEFKEFLRKNSLQAYNPFDNGSVALFKSKLDAFGSSKSNPLWQINSSRQGESGLTKYFELSL